MRLLDDDPDASGAGPGAVPSRLRRAAPTALAAFLYVLLASIGFWEVLARGPSTTMPCGCFDQAQTSWFLTWVPYAITHGHNPFFTTWLNPPGGVNLMDNASMPLLGLLMAPVTWIFGPVVSWNTLAVASLAGAALVAFCVFRRHAPWWPAAFAGGLVYGFGPYVATQDTSHLNLSFVLFPPLTLWFLEAILVRHRGRPWRWGLAFGLCVVGQFLVSTEILLTTAAMALVGVAVLALSRTGQAVDLVRRRPAAVVASFRTWLRWTAGATVTATVVAAAGVAYPLWMTFAGPQQVAGHETSRPDFLSANLAGYVLPSSNQLLKVPITHHLVDPTFVGGFLAENTTYLGLPLLLLGLVVAVAGWRRPIVRVMAVVAVVAGSVALGPRLFIGGHRVTGAVLPYHWLTRLPLFNDVIPVRLSLFVDLAFGLLLAVGLERLRAAVDDRRAARRVVSPPAPPGTVRPRRAGALVAATAGVAALLPILPAWPIPMQSAGVPSYFTSSAVKAIPPGSVADVYPFPRVTQAMAMLWQSEADMRFRLMGGFVLTPDPHGVGTEFGPKYWVTEIWFGSAFWIGGPFIVQPTAVTGVRAELRAQDVQTVIIARVGADPQGAAALITAAVGRGPRSQGGVWVWYDVQTLLRSQP